MGSDSPAYTLPSHTLPIQRKTIHCEGSDASWMLGRTNGDGGRGIAGWEVGVGGLSVRGEWECDCLGRDAGLLQGRRGGALYIAYTAELW